MANAMDSSSLKCFQIGKLVLSSGLLQNSWSKIFEIHESSCPNQDSGLRFEIYEEAKYTLVVFVAPSNCSSNSDSTLLSGSLNQNPFHFLCSENISSFSLHTPALQLFTSADDENHSGLKSKLLKFLKSKKPVILTGAALGGSVASLFTLWLLETVDPKLPRPLCITFGSPLIGDGRLQQILENSLSNSCFLHVVDAAKSPIMGDFFKPFGTFLICFESECICIEDPEAIMELLNGQNTDLEDWTDYGEVVNRLDQSMVVDSRLEIYDVIDRMKKRAAKKLPFDSLKKLNDIKISMMYIEWYKKISKKDKIGYYDRFKTHIASAVSLELDIDVEKRKREMNDYWKSLVEEAEKMPQSEKAILRTRTLFAGNNYRRMVEPLDIAEYYHKGLTNYRVSGRSRHYVMLEKWFKPEAEAIKPVRSKKEDLSDLLTFDSCFWAELEEAMIITKQLKTDMGIGDDKREILTGELVSFEEYAWEMIDQREVSPEIFLEKSSFMRWWKEYKDIRGRDESSSSSSLSELAEFMNTGKYEIYGQ